MAGSPGRQSEVNVADFYDPASPTCGIAEAIASLSPAGGRVRAPAGTYLLRQSVYLPRCVSLAGDGPATVLAIRPPESVALETDAREGENEFKCRIRPPFRVGDAVGICDDRQSGWHGTHGIVQERNGSRVRLNVALERELKVAENARAVRLFPAIYALDEVDIEIQDLTIRGHGQYQGPWWDFTYAAVHLVGCRRVRVVNCTVSDWASDGFGIQRGSDVQVMQCQAHGCRGHGFHPGTGLRASVWSHNIAEGNGGDGFFFCARVHHTVCSDSVFSRNGQHGIGGVANGGDHHNIISDNVCAYNGGCGIDANRGEEQVLSGNLLLSNSQEAPGRWPGIRLHDLERAIVQGNRCADDQATPTQTGGIVESGSSDYNLMGGNMCVGMREPIVVTGPNSRVEGNLV